MCDTLIRVNAFASKTSLRMLTSAAHTLKINFVVVDKMASVGAVPDTPTL